jgi:drug/metabolite transporter (DMT)-like permease
VKLSAYLAVGLQTLIAAGTFLVAKDATGLFGPGPLVWFRIVLSAILVGLVYRATHRGEPRPPSGDLLRLGVLGLLGVTLNQGFFLFGINLSTPLHASLLYAFTPVIVLAASAWFLGQPVTLPRILGVVLAVAGVALVLTAQGLDLTEGPLRGDLLILVAVAAWASYTVLGKRVLERYPPFTIITWAFLAGALSVLPVAPMVLRGFDPSDPGLTGWLELLYLSAITSGLAFTLWYFALRRLDATQVSVFTNLQAPLTALLVWMVFGDLPGAQVLLGGLLVLLGVTVVQLPLRVLRRARSRR